MDKNIMYRDYIAAGFRIITLHKVVDGECQCGYPDCENQYRHPKAKNYQHSPRWDEEQLRNLERYGFLEQSYGALVDDNLIIDVDPRNGGDVSYKKLCEDIGIDFIEESGFVVSTGGGGKHIYFHHTPGANLVTNLENYPGIDFKSSGYVIGCGSMHVSGNTYTCDKGFPDELTPAPKKLIDLLTRVYTATSKASTNGTTSEEEIEAVLSYIPSDITYEQWVQCGMAIHHETSGTGFDIWDSWSSNGEKYKQKEMYAKWLSFGKTSSPVTFGTLIHLAEQNGYEQPVTFEPVYADEIVPTVVENITKRKVDLCRPPGLAGTICRLMEGTAYRQIPELYPIAALHLMSLCAVGSYTRFSKRLNLLSLGIALSAAGKEGPQDTVRTIASKIGLGKSVYGGAGSFKEFILNMVESDGRTLYAVDEIHSLFNSMKSKQASTYESKMEAEILTMSSTSLYTFRGAEKREFSEKINNQIARVNKRIDEGENNLSNYLELLEQRLDWVENGFPNPHFSLMGHSTPDNIDFLINKQNIGSGLLGRMLIVRCNEYRARLDLDNMLPPHEVKKLQADIEYQLGMIQHHSGELEITEEAKQTLDDCLEYYEDDEQRNHLIMGALYARCYEQVLKISALLALDCMQVKKEHVDYAFALVENSIADITYLLGKNDLDHSSHVLKSDVLANAKETVMRNCGGAGRTPSSIKQLLCKPKAFAQLVKQSNADAVQDLLDSMVASGDLVLVDEGRKKRYTVKIKG
jgi:hypothetical protein